MCSIWVVDKLNQINNKYYLNNDSNQTAKK